MAKHRSPPLTWWDVFLMPKRPGVTLRMAWDEAQEERGFSRTNKDQGWTFEVVVRPHAVIARLHAATWPTARDLGWAPIVVLDYHRRPSTDDRGVPCPPGYHWDLFWPQGKVKVPLVPTPAHALEALQQALAMWNIHLDDDAQGILK